MAADSYSLSFLILLTFFSVVLSSNFCTFVIRVQTGTRSYAGTDARVSLKFKSSSPRDPTIYLPNLQQYGIMGAGHDYFEAGNLDVFSYTTVCYHAPVCYIELSHDNSGDNPGWYVGYVVVSTSGGPMEPTEKGFIVEQWLAKDEPPYKLSTSRDFCDNIDKQKSTGGIESIVDATI